MSYSQRTAHEVIAWMMAQHKNGSNHWRCLCQSTCRQAYGVPAWADSAIHAWTRIPNKHKHAGGDPSDAPPGAVLYYAGGKFGHAAIAGKRSHIAWSVDYWKTGHIGIAPRTFPRWNLTYVGWSTWNPFHQRFVEDYHQH